MEAQKTKAAQKRKRVDPALRAASEADVHAEDPVREMTLDEQTTRTLTDRLRRRPKPPHAQARATKNPPKGVIYVGHIPHGFYEEQMRPFFAQFGTVTRLRLARSKRTARSKGYAFVEFEDAEVARIVADAMNGYLMFTKVHGARATAKTASAVPAHACLWLQILDVHVVKPEDVHADTFKGAERKFRFINFRGEAEAAVNRTRSPEEAAKRAKRLLGREKRASAKLRELGVDFVGASYAPEAKAERKLPADKRTAALGKASLERSAVTDPTVKKAKKRALLDPKGRKDDRDRAKAKPKASAEAKRPKDPGAERKWAAGKKKMKPAKSSRLR